MSLKEKILTQQAEPFRYILNGLAATALHFAVLTLVLLNLGSISAGFANFIAAIFGVAASFFGNRYFVFMNYQDNVIDQARRFLLLYGVFAVMHGLTLYVWTDIYGYDYRIGFLVAVTLQVILSYWGNKKIVFGSLEL